MNDMGKEKDNKPLFLISALLMFILGASDALRGIFAPLFTGVFGFSVAQLGIIVSASYLGNLVCLLFGGIILDKIGRKKAMVLFILILAFSEILLIFGYRFPIIVFGFFLSLGVSTLLNTTINLISDTFSASKSLMYLNILFFLQMIATSGSQLILTRYSSSQAVWNATLITLAVLLIPIAIALSGINMGKDTRKSGNTQEKGKIDLKPIAFITISLGFYLIAEHGITNYILVYSTEHLKISASAAGLGLSLYSAGIMLGRLLLSPILDRIGAEKVIFAALIAGFLVSTAVFTSAVLPLLFLSGFAISIVYPSTVSLVRKHVPVSMGARATTMAVSVASLLDVIFNPLFGKAIDSFGYDFSMPLLCACFAIAAILWAPLIRMHR